MRTTLVPIIALVAIISSSVADASLNFTPMDNTKKKINNLRNHYASVFCTYQGEQTSGMNKICYYDCMGSAAAITISSINLCPLSIQN